MRAARTCGVLVVGILIAGTTVLGQQGGQVQPQIKPGVPNPGGPKGPDPKLPDPKGKLPDPKGKGMNPGPGVILVPVPGGTPTKKDEIKWPTEVNGRKVEQVAKDIRNHPDPAVREAAIRMLPAFGPKGRELAGADLVDAMTPKELDMNVRLAALNVAPTVLVMYATEVDNPMTNGINQMVKMLEHEALHVRFEAVTACGSIGPFLRQAQPTIIQKLTNRAREQGSWQMRRTAVMAIGSVGLGVPISPEQRNPPDPAAVTALLDIMRSDPCAQVRLAAVHALIGLGPVAPAQQKNWKTAVESVFKIGAEKDKGVLLWLRVLLIRNSPEGLKGNEPHLEAIIKVLEGPEAGGRLEAAQALGVLGETAVGKLQNLLDVVGNAKEDPYVVMAAIMALVEMPSRAMVTVPILNNVKMNHKNEDVRKVAEEAVKALTAGKN